MKHIFTLLLLLAFASFSATMPHAQDKPKDEQKKDEKNKDKDKKDKNKSASIGGKEHDAEIVGVKIGMDVPTALQAVFVNANRKPGQEKPDAQRKEGKDNKDIRVLYKGLPQGDLQIVFAEGKYVNQVVLKYAEPPLSDDLRLPYTGNIGEAIEGDRYDDRYTIGFTDNQKQQRIWWRDEKTPAGYRIRVQFNAKKINEAGGRFVTTVVQKSLTITPGEEEKFIKAISN
ncbi:MAG: hypothetical protein ABI954_08145 [Pyrinomonadaceae bacterium]